MNDSFLFTIKELYSGFTFYEKKSFKLIIIKRGSILYRLNSKENILIKNTVLFANNSADIFIKQSDKSQVIYILFTKQFLDQISSVHNRIIFNFFYRSNSENNSEIKTIYLNENNINFVSSAINSLIREYKGREPAYMSAIQAIFTELLVYFYRIYKFNKNTTIKHLKIEEIEFYIKNNYSESFTLNELAEKCGLNPSYFSRAFKSKTGMAVFEYINRIRIERHALF